MRKVASAGWDRHCGDIWRDAGLAAGGGDICDVVGPSPRNRLEWRAMLKRAGVSNLRDLVIKVHGPGLPVKAARRGDLVLYAGGALGIAQGETVTFLDNATAPLTSCDMAWRLG
jgi:hypothetical protein